jgi:hypothetical protein
MASRIEATYLKAGEVVSKGSRAPRVKGRVNAVSSVGYGHENASTGFGFDAVGELERIVSRLAQDIERFDSMIRDQRHLLQQHAANLGRPDERVLRLQSRRISVQAAEIASRTQGAIEELRGFSLPLRSDTVSESSQTNPS